LEKITIYAFGALKDFFTEKTELSVPIPYTGKEILRLLAEQKPLAEKILLATRIAINEELVSLGAPIDVPTDVYLLPPSSGG